jgi:hypothetical protein
MYAYNIEQHEFKRDSKCIVIGKPLRLWEDNTKMDFEQIGREDGSHVELAQGHLR